MRTLLALIILLPGLVHAANVRHAVGIARDATSNNVRYLEHHQRHPDGRLDIDYYTPGLELIAWKRISFPTLPQHPQIEQEDLNRGSRTLVSVSATEIRQFSESPAGTSETILPATPGLIVDAGFDAYIRANLDDLNSATGRKLTFAIAGVEQTLAMRISAVESSSDGTINFRVEPDSWLVRLFLPAIDLTYSRDGDLLAYHGYSNLLPDDRESRSVRIHFSYHETTGPLTRPLAAWLPQTAPMAE